MELKVWVEGSVKVVCGLTLDTSCQDVVVTLAQAIGQTGRYALILRLRGTERHLVATDCPLRYLGQLGQLSAEGQFILKRTGPSQDEARDKSKRPKLPVLPRHPASEPLRRKELQKSLTFSLGPSTGPRRTTSNRSLSSSPRSSPEPRVSPVPSLEALAPVDVPTPYPSKEEVFKLILRQQRRLQELESQVETLERDTETWEQERTMVQALYLEEVESLEAKLRQNELDLMQGEFWEEELQEEEEKEEELQRTLDQISSSLNDHNRQILEVQAHSVDLERDIKQLMDKQRPEANTPQTEETLKLLREELRHRRMQGEEAETWLSETEQELQAARERLQDRLELVEDLKKVLRQNNLQHFIQQTGVHAQAGQSGSPAVSAGYISNAAILETGRA